MKQSVATFLHIVYYCVDIHIRTYILYLSDEAIFFNDEIMKKLYFIIN